MSCISVLQCRSAWASTWRAPTQIAVVSATRQERGLSDEIVVGALEMRTYHVLVGCIQPDRCVEDLVLVRGGVLSSRIEYLALRAWKVKVASQTNSWIGLYSQSMVFALALKRWHRSTQEDIRLFERLGNLGWKIRT